MLTAAERVAADAPPLSEQQRDTIKRALRTATIRQQLQPGAKKGHRL
jgi:hypothetical protein